MRTFAPGVFGADPARLATAAGDGDGLSFLERRALRKQARGLTLAGDQLQPDQVAAALGAAGALIGTRFQATAEALADPEAKKAIVDGGGEDTERSSVLDIARGPRWPLAYTGRTLGQPFLDRWRDAEAELAADPGDAQRAYADGVARGELQAEPVWASQAIGLIRDLPPAAELVGVLAGQAEAAGGDGLGQQPVELLGGPAGHPDRD